NQALVAEEVAGQKLGKRFDVCSCRLPETTFSNFMHVVCSSRLFISFVHVVVLELISFFMHVVCSCRLFISFVHLVCSSRLFMSFVLELISFFMHVVCSCALFRSCVLVLFLVFLLVDCCF